MEICTLPTSTDSPVYEMRVGSLIADTLRKGHTSGSTSSSIHFGSSTSIVDMKRTHREMEGTQINSHLMNTTSESINLHHHQHKLKSYPSIISSSSSNESTDGSEESFNESEINSHIQQFQSTTTTTTSNVSTNCEIFLGGSCNPTSWRNEIAIPILNHSGISFFNPQVPTWCPELMAAEHEAKDIANILFFVIDSETRAIASMVEVAYLIAHGKRVTLVVAGTPKPGHIILGESISPTEIVELQNAQKLLRELAGNHQIEIFDCVRTAVCQIANNIRSRNGKDILLGDRRHPISPFLLPPCLNNTSQCHSEIPIPDVDSTQSKLDVFLYGVSIGDTPHTLAYLNKHGISYWNLPNSNTTSILKDKRIDETRILFFHVSSSERALETLILIAYFVGLGKNVILCIENLGEDTVIQGETLSRIAIKDYNRGRSYLRDVAQRKGLSTFSSLPEALEGLNRKWLEISKIQPKLILKNMSPHESVTPL